MTDKNSGAVASSETAEKIAFNEPSDPRYVIIDSVSGQVEGRKYHDYLDCNFLDKQPPEEIEVIGEREIRLLGIKVCSVCEKRASGGPALTAFAEVLDETNLYGDRDSFRDDAYKLIEALKDKGVWLAVRKAK